jgi:uncharacterized membrane protein YbaN (DUF454 family)
MSFLLERFTMLKKILLITAGSLCLVLGAIGMFLPILPTTPFVLAAAGCFSAYPAVYSKIRRIRFFREYLDAYKSGTRIKTSVRVWSIVLLWAALILSMILGDKTIMYIILPIVGVAVTIHLLTIGRGKKAVPETSEALPETTT